MYVQCIYVCMYSVYMCVCTVCMYSVYVQCVYVCIFIQCGRTLKTADSGTLGSLLGSHRAPVVHVHQSLQETPGSTHTHTHTHKHRSW